MNLLDELGNDLAFAFLVEKRHKEKIDSKEVAMLIEKIKDVLKPVSVNEKSVKPIVSKDNQIRAVSF